MHKVCITLLVHNMICYTEFLAKRPHQNDHMNTASSHCGPSAITRMPLKVKFKFVKNILTWYQMGAYDLQINFGSSGPLKYEPMQNSCRFSIWLPPKFCGQMARPYKQSQPDEFCQNLHTLKHQYTKINILFVQIASNININSKTTFGSTAGVFFRIKMLYVSNRLN